MQILEHQHDRGDPAEAAQPGDEGVAHPLGLQGRVAVRRAHGQARLGVGRRQSEQVGQACGHRLSLVRVEDAGDPLGQPGSRDVGRRVLGDAQALPNDIGQKAQRRVAAQGVASSGEHDGGGADCSHQLRAQSRLARAGLSDDERRSRLSLGDATLEARAQRLELVGAAHERGRPPQDGPGRVRGLERLAEPAPERRRFDPETARRAARPSARRP